RGPDELDALPERGERGEPETGGEERSRSHGKGSLGNQAGASNQQRLEPERRGGDEGREEVRVSRPSPRPDGTRLVGVVAAADPLRATDRRRAAVAGATQDVREVLRGGDQVPDRFLRQVEALFSLFHGLPQGAGAFALLSPLA